MTFPCVNPIAKNSAEGTAKHTDAHVLQVVVKTQQPTKYFSVTGQDFSLAGKLHSTAVD